MYSSSVYSCHLFLISSASEGQRSPSKMVGAGAAAAQHLSNCEKIPYMREQRRSPSKVVGEEKSCLESNPIPTRDAQRTQTNLVHTRTQRPTGTETELCLSISCGGMSEKAMATHSSTLAWKIPWMEEPGRLQSMGLRRVGHD